MSKFFLYLVLFIFLSNCGFKDNKVEKNPNAITLFEKLKPIEQELNPTLNVKISTITKGEPFLSSNSNNSGNLDFNSNFENTTSYKFSTIDQFKFNQPEILFTEDNSLVFFTGKGEIFKTSTDFEKYWRVNHYTKKEKKLKPILYFAQSGSDILVLDNLSKVYSIKLETGELNWTIESKVGFNSNAKIIKESVVAVDFDNVIRAFSVKDGKELWNFDTDNPFIKSQKKLSLVTKGEVVFFINSIGDVTALNANDGSLVWQTPTQSTLIFQDAFTLENSDIIFANDTIYFSNNRNEFFAIDARSGVLKYKQTINSSLRPTVIENYVFSISKEGFLFVIDDKTGNVLRITNIFKNIENKKEQVEPTGFILAQNSIYISLNNGKLIKLNAISGNEEGFYKIGKSRINRPNVFDDGMFILKSNAIIKVE
ncbi:MAG: PQQ-binding-like beta-propeller repeat protein [Candidatus Pelagibacter sp.]